MNQEQKTCSTCGTKLRANNKSGICTPCQKPNRYKKADEEGDDVLSRMGFGALKKRPAAAPAPLVEEKPKAVAKKRVAVIVATPRGGRWEDHFRSLATALGLGPGAMIETHCREWVEKTRTRALAAAAPTEGLNA